MGKWRSAAEAVLRDAGIPLHYKEITKRAMSGPSFDPGGLTPEASMGAVIYSDISLHVKPYQPGYCAPGHGPEGRFQLTPYEGVH